MTDDATTLRIGDLLREREWMRRLAGALVRDDAAADDLAQDAWVTALERPPRRATSLRGWLASVLRSRAADAARSEGSRRAREDAVRRRDADTGSPDVLAAHAESQRRVLDAVMRLPKASRDAVLLRYFEGLDPSAIAARTGEPGSTVRTRLQRALETLRADLDREHGGDGRTWRAAVAPLAAGGTAGDPGGAGDARASRSSTRASSPPRTGGGRALRPIGLLALAVAAAVALVLLTRGGDARDARGPAAPGAVATGTHADAPAAPPRPSPAPRAAVPEPPAPPAAAVPAAAPGAAGAVAGSDVRVTVRSPRGIAVAGATVRWLTQGGGKSVWRADDRPPGATDAEGVVRLRVSEGLRARAWVTHGALAAISDAADRDVAIVLGDAFDVRGVVTSAAGGPVAGATVTLSSGEDESIELTTRSGADGRFAIDGLPVSVRAAGYHVEARAADLVPAGVAFAPAARGGGAPRSHDLVLRAARTVRGRCVDREGRAVRGVLIDGEGAGRQFESAADGRFTIAAMPLDARRIVFQPDDLAARRVDLDPAPGAAVDLGDVVLDRGGTIRGRVVGAGGRGIANASINVHSEELDQFVRFGGTGEDGSFSIDRVGAGPHTLWVSSGAKGPDGFSLEARAAGCLADGPPVEIVLTAARKVRVRLVLDEDGSPVAVASVSLELRAAGAEDPERSSTSSDPPDSVFEVVAERTGAYDVTVRASGFEPFTAHGVEVAADGGVEVVARLRRAAR